MTLYFARAFSQRFATIVEEVECGCPQPPDRAHEDWIDNPFADSLNSQASRQAMPPEVKPLSARNHGKTELSVVGRTELCLEGPRTAKINKKPNARKDTDRSCLLCACHSRRAEQRDFACSTEGRSISKTLAIYSRMAAGGGGAQALCVQRWRRERPVTAPAWPLTHCRRGS